MDSSLSAAAAVTAAAAVAAASSSQQPTPASSHLEPNVNQDHLQQVIFYSFLAMALYCPSCLVFRIHENGDSHSYVNDMQKSVAHCILDADDGIS
jgi:hypothetical protein